MKPNRQVAVCSLLSLVMQSANAADYASDLDYYQDFPVVLSASRLRQPLSEAPNAMTVIDRKMIIASGFRSIPDLFKLVPGMYVSYYKGSQAFVSYHGSTDQNARRMQVMIDGRSVYMPPVSAIDWATFPITIDDIEHIEVIRGPAAASYGANSTQGVISITTRDAGEMDGRSVSVTHGSKGINDVSARFGKRGETLDYRMTLAYSADNGYDNLTTPPNNIPVTQFQANTLLNNSNDSNQARLFNFRADYHPNGVDRFDVQFGFNHDMQGVGFNDRNTGNNTNPFHDLFVNSGFLQLEWLRQLENASELSLCYFHIRHDKHESLPYYLSGRFFPGPISQSTQIGRDEIEIKHTLPLSASNRLVYGAAYQTSQISGKGDAQALSLNYSSSSDTHEYRVFAHDEWRITPKLLLNTGGMFEQDSTGHQNVSPRVALNLHVTPQHALRIGASVAYRTPSIAEEKYPIDRLPRILPGALFVPSQNVTEPGLVPEKLVSREIGYLGEFPDWATTLDLRLFHDQVSNGIYLSSANMIVNGVSSTYQGIEATLKHSFNENSNLTVNFAHELASSNGPVLAAAGQKYLKPASPWISDILSASIPRNSASVLYSQHLTHDVAFSAAYYYQDAMQPFDRGAIDYQPIQRRTDVRVAKAFRQDGGVKGEVALVLQNLFDKGYTEYIASNLFNRRGYVTLTLKW
ncbi:MAG: TonB-dependent receptor [Sterolibacterium sp.]|nr:TonB-dependent receptor [Sterolibacterium sp.]